MGQAPDPGPAQHAGEPQPQRRELAHHEEAVFALLLVEGHEDAARLGSGHTAPAVVAQHVAGADRLEVQQAGAAAVRVFGDDGVAVLHLQHAGQGAVGAAQRLEAPPGLGYVCLRQQPRRSHRQPDGPHRPVASGRLLVLAALEDRRGVAEAVQVADQRAGHGFVQPEHQRRGDAHGEAAVAQEVGGGGERAPPARSGVQVQHVDGAAAALGHLGQHAQQPARLAVFPGDGGGARARAVERT